MTLGPGWRRLVRIPRLTRRAIERDVDDELAFHLTMRAEKLRDTGTPADVADARAQARFGDATRVRDELLTIDRQFAREARVIDWLDSLRADVRYAFRTLRRSPAFTLVAALTLALGIGATSAIFSVVNGILLEPLPYPHPERIVWLEQSYPEKGLDQWPLSQENVAMYRDRVSDFASFAGYARRSITLGGERPERLRIERTTGEFFDVLGVPPMLGHAYSNAEDAPGKNDVVVLSYGFWRSHLGGRRDVVGTTLELDGRPTTILGVMPRGFAFPDAGVQLYLPVGLDPTRRFGWFMAGIARLRPGVSIAEARAQTRAIFMRWAARAPGLLGAGMAPERTRLTTLMRPMQATLTRDVRRPLLVLQGAVLLILLIAIANVATLQSSRAAGRAREMVLRGALGATRARVIRQLLTESLALALLGGGLGVSLAWIVVRALTQASALNLPRVENVTLDARVLAVTAGIAIGSGVLFGLAPLWHLMRGTGRGDLASGQRETSHRGARRVNDALIVAQLALSVTLLVAAGLVLQSFRNLLGTDLGFDPRGVTAIAVPLPAQTYVNSARTAEFATAALREIRAVPGVAAASITATMPLSGSTNTDGYLIEGHAPPTSTGTEKQVVTELVMPDYFRTMGISLLRGRDFNSADRDGSLPVTIIDATLAREYWPELDAVGKRMRLTGDTTWYTIVGVVGSIRDEDVSTAPDPHMYSPFEQSPDTYLHVVVRTRGDGAIARARNVLHRLEPGAPLDDIRPVADYVRRSLDTRRVTEILLAAFAGLAVLLAVVGIYGVMSLYVANRTQEFGIRMAIGASPARVLGLVLTEGFSLALLGAILGLGGALLATRWLGTLLYGVSAHDPMIYTLLPLGLVTIAVGSCLVPARRAARADPSITLRAD